MSWQECGKPGSAYDKHHGGGYLWEGTTVFFWTAADGTKGDSETREGARAAVETCARRENPSVRVAPGH